MSTQSTTQSQTQVTPEPLLQLGLAFWGSKVFLTAAELGVFSHLARGPLVGQQLADELKLHPRSWRDFLDTLVALKLLDRDGQVYRNSAVADAFLDKSKPGYLGGFFEMCNARLYSSWDRSPRRCAQANRKTSRRTIPIRRSMPSTPTGIA